MYIVSKTLKPDIWLSPSEVFKFIYNCYMQLKVWEIEADKLTLSSVYTIGKKIIDSDRGLSLRFPRLKRIRDDKKAEQSTPIDDVFFFLLDIR